MKRAVDWLLAHQDSDGSFTGSNDSFPVEEALVVLALAVTCQLDPSPELHEAVRRGVVPLIRQRPWGYNGRSGVDALFWAILALERAKDLGIEVPDGVYDVPRIALERPAAHGTLASLFLLGRLVDEPLDLHRLQRLEADPAELVRRPVEPQHTAPVARLEIALAVDLVPPDFVSREGRAAWREWIQPLLSSRIEKGDCSHDGSADLISLVFDSLTVEYVSGYPGFWLSGE